MDTVNKLSNIITVPSSIRSEPTRYPLDLLPVIANKVLHPLSQPPSAGRLSDLVLALHHHAAGLEFLGGGALCSQLGGGLLELELALPGSFHQQLRVGLLLLQLVLQGRDARLQPPLLVRQQVTAGRESSS